MKITLNTGREIMVDMNNLTNDEKEKFWELIGKAKQDSTPLVGNEYWSIDSDGDTIWNYVWRNNDLDRQHYSIGNCFKTRQNAMDAIERLKIRAELQHYADEHNDQKIDWTNDKQDKWYICFDYDIKRFRLTCMVLNMTRDTFQIYFTSKKIAHGAVKAVGEDRIKKYLFEVES